MANQDFRVKNGLQVGLGASVVGIVTAESFSGSAVGLTNVPSASLTGTISSERLSGTYNIDILGTVSGATISATTATVTEQLNVGAGDTGVFATATDGTLSVSGVSTFSGDLTVGTATTGSVVRTDGTLNVSGIATFKDRVIFDSTNSVQIPVGTEAEKDAVGTAVTGQIRYNTTNSQFEGFGPGNDWGSLGGVKDVDGDTYVKPESSPGSDEDALTFFTGGTERAVIDSDGKVGIGSTQPTSTLDLDGTLNVSGISTFEDRVIFDSTNSIQIPVGTTADRDAVGTAVTGQIRYNTTLSSFEGYGPGGEWGTLGGVKDIDQDTYITAQKDLAVDDDALRFYTNGTEQVSIDSTGKVGIGSTQPTAKLDVSGDIVSSGNLLPLTDNTGVVGNASYTWSNGQFTNLTIDSTLNVRSAIDLADNDILRFGSSDDVKVFYDGTNNDLEIELESAATQIAITDNGTYKHIITKDGKIGVNTSVIPSSELEVYGNIKLTGAIYGSTELIIDPMPIGVGTTSGIVRIKGDLYVDGTTTQINSTSLEIADFIVGIASTATTDLLADGAGIQIGPDNTLLYQYNSGTNPSLQSSENLSVATGKVYQIGTTERLSANTLSLGTGTTIHSPSNQILTLGTGGQERVRVDSSGNVGIGTDNATSKLDVNGTLNVSGVSTFSDDLIVGTATTGVVARTDGTLNVSGVSTFSDDLIVGTATTGVVARTDGTLNVSGVSTFQNHVHLGDSDTLYLGDGNDLRIKHDSGNSYITDSGTLLINTATNLEIANISGVSKRAIFKSDAVELYSGGNKKFETTGYGVTVTGGLNVSGVSTFSDDLNVGAGDTGVFIKSNGDIFSSGIVTATTFDISNSGNLVNGDYSARITARNDSSNGNVLYINPIDNPGTPATGNRLSIGINTTSDYGTNASGAADLFFVGEDNIIFGAGYPKIKIANPNALNGNFYEINAVYTNAFIPYGYIRNELTDATYSVALNGSFAFSVGDRDSSLNSNRASNFNSGKEAFVVILDGSTSLFHNKSKKLETSGVGVTVTGITQTDNLNVGTAGTVITTTSSGLVGIGSTIPQAKLDVVGVATFSDSVYLNSGKSIYFGNKFDILQNGSTQSVIRTQSGNTIYLASGSAVQITNTIGGDISAVFTPGGDVALRYANDVKFRTTNTGVNIPNGQYEIGGSAVLSGTTLGSAVVNSSLTGVGTLTQLNVSGVSTFSDDLIVGTATTGVVARTDGTLNVSGVSTFITSDTVNQPWPTSSGDGTAIRIKATRLSSYDSTGNGSVSGLDESYHLQGRFPANVSIANTLGTAGINFSDGDIGREVASLTQYSGSFALFTRNSTYDYSDNFIWASPNNGIQVGYSTLGGNTSGFVINKTSNDGNGNITQILRIDAGSDDLIFSGQNVGIGSDNPTAKLDVTGGLNVSGISTFQDNVNIGIGGTTALFDVSSGKVGIGSTNPIYPLDVNGDVNSLYYRSRDGGEFNGQLYLNLNGTALGEGLAIRGGDSGNGGAYVRWMSDAGTTGYTGHYQGITSGTGYDYTIVTETGLGFRVHTNGNITANSDFYINPSGNVGIGSTQPTSKLDVDGGVNVSGVSTISVNSSSDALRVTQLGTGNALVVEDSTNPDATPFVIDREGQVGIGTTNPTRLLNIEGIDARVRYVETNATTDNRVWNVGVNGEEFYWQAINDSAGGGGSKFTITRSGNLIQEFQGSYAGSAWFTINNPNQRVGIGSTIPTAKLDVNGTLNVSGVSTISVNSTSDALRITQTGSGNALVVEDSTNPDTSPFIIDANGSIGIGTVSVNSTQGSITRLNIHAGSSYGGLRITNPVDGSGITRGLLLGYIASENAYLMSSYDRQIIINTTGAEPLLLQSGGEKVGIGSTQPTSTLDVNGTLNVSGVSTISVNSTSDALRITQTGSGNALVVEDSTNPDATPFVINTNGRVSIGTNTSSSNWGMTLYDVGIQINNSTEGSGTFTGLTFSYEPVLNGNYIVSWSKPLLINSVSSDVILQSSANNVGIGSTIPTAKLDVNGTLNVSGVSTISVNSTSDALRITQTGTGNALVVEDSANPDSSPFIIDANGSIGIGTVSVNSTQGSITRLNIHAGTDYGGLRITNPVDGSGITRGLLLGYIASENAYLMSSYDRQIIINTTGAEPLLLQSGGRKVGIGSTQPTSTLDVNGTLNVSGVSTFITSDTVNQPWPTSSGDGTAIRIKATRLSSYDSSGNGSISSLDGSQHMSGIFPANVSIANTLGTAGINFSDGDLSRLVVNATQYSGSFTIFTRNSTYANADNFIWASPSRGIHVGYSTGEPTAGFFLRKTKTNGNGTPTEILKIGVDDNLIFYGENVGIGSASPTAKLDVNGSIAIKNHSIVSITTSHTASAGTPFTIDTFATSANDLAEYTIHVGYGTYIQAQKVLVMHDGVDAYSQEYAIMHNPSKIVSIEASISGSNVLLQATPETGISGITTYKIVRGGLV